ncbi:MAG: S8 family serine peptidase [Deltaproteobacteria bacterium]|nr:S8 family serine peptidase [Deltaproteobacteria bacterium]
MSCIRTIDLEEETDLSKVIDTIRALPEVKYVQPNYRYFPDAIPTDPQYDLQWSHQITEAEAGWDFQTGSHEVVVAVIDNEIGWTHEELVSRIWANPSDVADGIDNDGNGYVDDVRGWDFSGGDNDPMPDPGQDIHGTSVASIIGAAANNGRGIVGVMWDVSLMPLRISYTTESVTEALYYALLQGADVVNMSFGNYEIGRYGTDTTVHEAIQEGTTAGIVYVATAGNDSIEALRYPAALSEVLSVTATDEEDQRASFSN